MKVKKFNEKVILPTKSHALDCGLDLHLCEDLELNPMETKCIGMGLGFEIPEGCAGQFVPRSSIAKKGIVVHPAIIDPGYTGEVHLIITNASTFRYDFKEGDRVGSLVLYNIINPTFEVVKELGSSERGTNGLGSSGK